MLVLTRKVEDIVKIGDHITVKVVRVNGNQVRLGIEAPNDIPITRGEIDYERAKQAGIGSGPSVAVVDRV